MHIQINGITGWTFNFELCGSVLVYALLMYECTHIMTLFGTVWVYSSRLVCYNVHYEVVLLPGIFLGGFLPPMS